MLTGDSKKAAAAKQQVAEELFAVVQLLDGNAPSPAQTQWLRATLDAIYENTGDAVDAADAKFLYKAAILNLC